MSAETNRETFRPIEKWLFLFLDICFVTKKLIIYPKIIYTATADLINSPCALGGTNDFNMVPYPNTC